MRPKVLLLDEPLGALDLKLRHEMQIELKHIQQEVGITFIYVTHDQEEALTMSDRLAVFNHGQIEQLGTPAEVYERPATGFVAGFVGVVEHPAGRGREGDDGSTSTRSRSVPRRSRSATPERAPSTADEYAQPDTSTMSYTWVRSRGTWWSSSWEGRLVVMQQNLDDESMEALEVEVERVRPPVGAGLRPAGELEQIEGVGRA